MYGFAAALPVKSFSASHNDSQAWIHAFFFNLDSSRILWHANLQDEL